MTLDGDKASPPAGSQELLERAAPKVRELALSQDLLRRIKEDLDHLIVGEDENKLLLFMVCASSCSSRPLGAIITGSSSSGKSTLLNRVLKYFSNVDYYTRVTGASLDRLERDMRGRILVVEELGGVAAAQPTLRVWISEGQLKLLTTEVDERGRITTREIATKGTPAFLTTTTDYAIDEETQNRLLILSMDESPEQTKRIQLFQAKAFSDPGFRLEPDPTIKGFLETLLPWEVVVPFAEDLARSFPSDTVRARRDLWKLLQITEVSAFLHQHQRCLIQDPTNKLKIGILADPVDLQYALDIAGPSLNQSLMGLQRRAMAALQAFQKVEFHTSRSLGSAIGLSQNRARELATALVGAGYLEVDESGREHHYYLTKARTPGGLGALSSIGEEWPRERALIWLRDQGLEILRQALEPVYMNPLGAFSGNLDIHRGPYSQVIHSPFEEKGPPSPTPGRGVVVSLSKPGEGTIGKIVPKAGTNPSIVPIPSVVNDTTMPFPGEGGGPKGLEKPDQEELLTELRRLGSFHNPTSFMYLAKCLGGLGDGEARELFDQLVREGRLIECGDRRWRWR